MKYSSCNCGVCIENGCKCGPYSAFFSALGNTNRLHILTALKTRPMYVTEIVDITSIEQSCVSHCLKILIQNGFVKYAPKGKYRLYSLNEETVVPLLNMIDKHIEENLTIKQKVRG